MTVRESWDALLNIPVEQILGAFFAFGIGFIIVTAIVVIACWLMTD